jgi:hypothetical protein
MPFQALRASAEQTVAFAETPREVRRVTDRSRLTGLGAKTLESCKDRSRLRAYALGS